MIDDDVRHDHLTEAEARVMYDRLARMASTVPAYAAYISGVDPEASADFASALSLASAFRTAGIS